MPRGDRRGPEGLGPMTGRGAGLCAGNDEPGFAGDSKAGRGSNNARGAGLRGSRGRGFRNRYFESGFTASDIERFESSLAPAAKDDEIRYLKGEAALLKKRLSAINERIADLDSASPSAGSGRQDEE